VTSLRPQEPHPLRQSASPVDVPHDERDDAHLGTRSKVVKEFFPVATCAHKMGLLRLFVCARRLRNLSIFENKDSFALLWINRDD
jgi:hypothetical protein